MEVFSRDGEHILPAHLQVVAWELTKSCNLYCAHCRGSAETLRYDGELSTEECLHIVDEIAAIAKPVLILTGGEPLAHPDLCVIGRYAAEKGFMVALGTNGTLITPEVASKLRDVPVFRVGVSLDFPVAELQDEFRGHQGAFESALAGIANALRAGVSVQLNTTITKRNVAYLDRLLALALDVGAVAFHPFMLVPTGRGKGLRTAELSSEEYERILNWMYDRQVELGDRIFFKPTDVPHYMRVFKQRHRAGRDSDKHDVVAMNTPARRRTVNMITRGCLAGTGFCFISHRGRVQGCGYLDVEAGNLRNQSFAEIWSDSPLFKDLRDLPKIKGKCGRCEYLRICGGCRARAYEVTGDYLETEPYCQYQPVNHLEEKADALSGVDFHN